MRAIGKKLTQKERAALIAFARSMIGTKFRHMGRSLRSVDCAGLILLALQSLGRQTVDIAAYGRTPHKDGLREAVRANLGKPVTDEIRPGDVLLMEMNPDPSPGAIAKPSHVALVAWHEKDGLILIHTDSTIGEVTEHGFRDPWPQRVIEVYRP